jgi:hypothetical protein
MRAADHGERADRLGDRDLERQPIDTRARGVDEAVKRGGPLVGELELRERHGSALTLDVGHVGHRQRDGCERRRSAVGEVPDHVPRLLHEDASGHGAPHLAASPPLGITAVDAPDSVVLLHARVQRRRGRAHHAETGHGDGELDRTLHRAIVRRRAKRRLGILGGESRQEPTSACGGGFIE